MSDRAKGQGPLAGVRVVDLTSTSDHPPTVPIGVWSKPVYIALNTKTARAYVTG